MIKKFFEYNSNFIRIGELELDLTHLDKYIINNIDNNEVSINPKYCEKILKKYPFFKIKIEKNHKYLEYSSFRIRSTYYGLIIISEYDDDYFYITILTQSESIYYKIDQFSELMRFLYLLLKNN